MIARDELLVEDAVYLGRARCIAVAAPHMTLLDLVRLEERLAAHLDAAAVAMRARPSSVFEESDDPFVGVALALRLSQVSMVDDLLRTEPPSPALLCGLAWEIGSSPAVVRRMLGSTEETIFGPGLALAGMLRLDAGETIALGLSSQSPPIRARAARATGQLGRRDLLPQLLGARDDPDPECRFWSAWAAARMGADAPLDTLADIAWNDLPRAGRALDLLLRRLDLPRANAWLRDLAKQTDRQRDLIRATGIVGDPLYIPWLIERMAEPATARLAGEAFCMITGLDLAYRDLDRRPPADFQAGPNDDPEDENVALDEDENLPWPDPDKLGAWWTANRARFGAGTPYFLGAPKQAADWLEALSDAFQRQRHAAALELAIRQPGKAMFEVHARGRLQRQMIVRARGAA